MGVVLGIDEDNFHKSSLVRRNRGLLPAFFGGGVKPIVGKVTIFISFHK